jgi:hypothetical protein
VYVSAASCNNVYGCDRTERLNGPFGDFTTRFGGGTDIRLPLAWSGASKTQILDTSWMHRSEVVFRVVTSYDVLQRSLMADHRQT